MTESVEDSKASAAYGLPHRHRGERHVRAGRIRHHSRTISGAPTPPCCSSASRPRARSAASSRRGEKSVKIHGEEIEVRASHPPLRGLFRPCRRAGAGAMAEGAPARSPNVFLTHGEEEGQIALAADLRQRWWPRKIIRPAARRCLRSRRAPGPPRMKTKRRPRIDPLKWQARLAQRPHQARARPQ